MDISFWKMHGAGNDFILVDDRTEIFPISDRAWLRHICARRDGIGAEGLLLLQNSKTAHVRMRFFNPDGSKADLCGNGARCVARLAYDLGIAPREMRLETDAGEISAAILADTVRLGLPEPENIRLGTRLEIPGMPQKFVDLIKVGVPHAIVWVENLETVDVAGLGAAIRNHKDLAPAGANVDFAEITQDGLLRTRTYERGVEAETLACGTGIAASAVAAVLGKKAEPPVRVQCRHGEILIVGMNLQPDRVSELTLEGPAVYVFHGGLNHD